MKVHVNGLLPKRRGGSNLEYPEKTSDKQSEIGIPNRGSNPHIGDKFAWSERTSCNPLPVTKQPRSASVMHFNPSQNIVNDLVVTEQEVGSWCT